MTVIELPPPAATVYDDLPPLLPSDRTNLAGQTTGREHLSHTRLSTALACWQKYDWRYVRRLERVSRAEALSLGSAFHKGVELGSADAAVEAIAAESVREFDQADIDARRTKQAIVYATTRLYLASYPEEETSEFEYLVRLRSPWTGAYSRTFDLLGFADGLIDRGDHWTLIERKLVGQITDVSVRKLPLDRQLALECYGVWRATGKPVREVLYRFVKKPGIRQKQTETVDEYVRRLLADYEERPEFYTHEERLHRSTDDLVRVEAELWEWAEEARRHRGRRIYPRNSSVCSEYGGCEFIPLCIADPDAPALYQVREEFSNHTSDQKEAA